MSDPEHGNRSFGELRDPLRARLRQVEQDIDAGRLRAAGEAMKRLLDRWPNDFRVPLVASKLAEVAADSAAAKKFATRAAALNPASPLAQMQLAKALSREGAHDAAVDAALLATRYSPNDPMILPSVTAVANAAKRYDVAATFLDQAAAIYPDAPSVQLALAENALDRADFATARQRFDGILRRAVIARDDEAMARYGRARAALAVGDDTQAADDYAWLSNNFPDRADYRFHAAVISGEAVDRWPEQAATELFDGIAARFDKHLVGALGYRLPSTVASIIRDLDPAERANILDLGCGTGLLGVYLGRSRRLLVGADISTRMLEQAARHQIYTRLHCADIDAVLRDTGNGQYDIITILDTFPYFGEIRSRIAAAARVLKPDGCLLFSVELAGEREPHGHWRLTQRAAHTRDGVIADCAAAYLTITGVDEIVLRREGEEQVTGLLVSARRTGAAH